MVNFRTIATAALAAFSAPVFAAISPEKMVENINTLTTKSQALQAPAQSIDVINTPLIIIGQGPFPGIIAGFADIVTTTTGAIAGMQGSLPVPAGKQSDDIFDAFREFVRVHQVLLNILIGKAGLLQAVPIIGPPVAAVLVQLEKVVDTIALDIIRLVESRADDLRMQASSLSVTIKTAQNKYKGLTLSKRETREARAARAIAAAA